MGHTLFKVQFTLLTINYDICLSNCLVIVSKVVVKFRYGVRLRMCNMVMQNLCFISTNKQPIS